MPDVRIDVYADTHGAPDKLGATERALGGIESQGVKTGGALGGLWAQVAAGNIVANAAQKAIGALTDFMKDSFKAAIESEDANNNLRAALESQGRAVVPLIEHYSKYADELMKQTVYDDEAIKGSQALLIQMGLNDSAVDEATRGAIGLASVFKMDLQSATRAVAQGYEGNFMALGRMIPAVREAKTEGEKMAAMQDFLGKAYQRAQAETNTYGGALKQLNNMWGEAKEQVGGAIIGNEDLRAAIKSVSNAIKELVESGKLSEWVSNGVRAITNYMQAMKLYAESVREADQIMRGSWLFSGAKSNVPELIRAAKDEAVAFQKELKVFTPSMEKIQGVMEQGPAVWKAWKAEVLATDKILDQNRSTIVGWVEKAVKWLDTTKALIGPVQLTGDALERFQRETKAAADKAKDAADAKKKLAAAAQAVLDKVNPLAAAVRKLRDEEKTLDDARKAGLITAQQHAFGVGALRVEYNNLVVPIASATDALLKFADAGGNKVIPGLRNVQIASQKAVFSIGKSWGQGTQDWLEKNRTAWEGISMCANAAISGMDAILQQSTNNKMLALDTEYQVRLDFIKKSTMSEEEKQKAITALEAEYEIKRRGVQHQAAVKGKAVSLAEAIMNTASGVTGALTMKPWTPYNWILASITGALGAIQIGLIRSTPVPLAHGAIFREPAMLTSRGGNTYEVAEAGEAEILTSSRKLQDAIFGRRGGNAGSQRLPAINLTIPIYIAGHKVDQQVIQIVRKAGEIGKLGQFGRALGNG